ncbi:MAG: UDP-N-acetylmuramate--L-alanine ligase [Aquificae bacterium]|nr:UDP-N-acetylmuramate--L-alanine ligase [Aquificota bacterium]
MFLDRIRHFHLVGIGGIGMSGIAHLLLDMGYRVSGSDLSENKSVLELRRRGARVFIGHRKENLPPSADVVVYSSAVNPATNPETREARRRGIPVIPRGEMLAELMRLKEGIAVSGSHGKTTTTSMLAHVFYRAGLDPTVIIGGKLHLFEGKNARLGKGEVLIAEADESDGSFLKLSPVVSVITNVDREHLDYYKSFEEIKRAFLEFANKVPFYGFTVVNIDDPTVRELFPLFTRKVVTFGLEYPSDYGARDVRKTERGYSFLLTYKGDPVGRLELTVMGLHNVYNALAAAAVSLEAELPFETVAEALREFKNAERRLQKLGEGRRVLFFEDYAHHPREIEAVLSTLREFFPDREVVFVFQPHRYTRTFYLWREFVEVLKPYRGIVTEIYPASEEPIPNVSGRRLAAESGSLYAETPDEVAELLERLLAEGDGKLVVFLGAGSIGRWAGEVVSRLLELGF